MTNSGQAAPRLFGTDGVRGVAGAYPLDRLTVRRLGAALVRAVRGVSHSASSRPLHVLVGRDTRESGSWIEAELAGGAGGEGAKVTSAGVVPTPAIAYLTRASTEFDIGVVISASHNPYQDNGLKVFSGKGEKFTESVERVIEQIVADTTWREHQGDHPLVYRDDLVGAYEGHLRAVFPEIDRLGPFVLGVDCANGATTTVAPALFNELGITTRVIGNRADGRNINLNTGSTHPDALARLVVDRRCHMGVAFDGDGDRAIFVDDGGRVVDGDAVLLVCGRHLHNEGRLKGNTIVATVMSNIGLELALRPLGIDLVRCAVGDKYVMEEMLKRDLSLGGEQSGHVIFSDYLFTGDGLCTALNVLRVLALTGQSLAELSSGLTRYPQVLLNVPVREKADLKAVPAIASAIARAEARVEGQGRVLVRYSGTEPLLRVMLEGRNRDEIMGWAQEIADVVKLHLG